jgi:hypothetical protein
MTPRLWAFVSVLIGASAAGVVLFTDVQRCTPALALFIASESVLVCTALVPPSRGV